MLQETIAAGLLKLVKSKNIFHPAKGEQGVAFTHLHVHTEYSLLDASSKIKELTARAKELGMDSLAITDHGVMYGVIDFYRAAKEAGIKPIIGQGEDLCSAGIAVLTRRT